MWHKPHLLTAVADLLLAAAAATLLVAGVLWASRLPLFPLREVVFAEAPKEVQRGEIERALSGMVRGNFFSLDVERIRQSLEKLPWVRRADVRRQWPSRVLVRLEEHRAVARWGDGTVQLVNSYGEVFHARSEAKLPRLAGPQGSSAEVLKRFEEFAKVFAAVGRAPKEVVLSARLAWQVRLDDGMLVELGREQPKVSTAARLARFIEAYPQAVAARPTRPAAVDLRYPNGFALRVAGPSGVESKG